MPFRRMTMVDELQLARDEAARIVNSRNVQKLDEIIHKQGTSNHYRDFVGLFLPPVLTTLLEKHVEMRKPLEPELLAMMEHLESLFQQIMNGREQFFLILSRYSLGSVFGLLSQSLRQLEGDLARRHALAYIIDLIGSLHELCVFESPQLALVIERRIQDYQELDAWYHNRFRRFKSILLSLLDLLYVREMDIQAVLGHVRDQWPDHLVYQTIADSLQSNQYLNNTLQEFCLTYHLDMTAVEFTLLRLLRTLRYEDIDEKTRRYIDMFLVSRHRLTRVRDHLPLTLFPIVPREILSASRTKHVT